IYPAEMWINGVAYSVRMEIINNTPVEMDLSFNQEKKQLVPKTALKVLKLTPAPYTQTKYFGDISRIAANNELVIVYKQNGKFFYNSVKNMKELEAAAMQ
ncbi:MAG: hypothetical protein H0U44_00935, partial [Flavisolibacter sp.]|nr:hypothetical protein [Flavisolibacter sp.]